MGMKSFETLDKGGKKTVLAKATTRAGLATAALQGLGAIAGGKTSELDAKIERPFSVVAVNFGALLATMLNSAAKNAAEHGESYDDVKFTLITEKKAEGAFVGRPSTGVTVPGDAHVAHDVTKNEAGEWETSVSFY